MSAEKSEIEKKWLESLERGDSIVVKIPFTSADNKVIELHLRVDPRDRSAREKYSLSIVELEIIITEQSLLSIIRSKNTNVLVERLEKIGGGAKFPSSTSNQMGDLVRMMTGMQPKSKRGGSPGYFLYVNTPPEAEYPGPSSPRLNS